MLLPKPRNMTMIIGLCFLKLTSVAQNLPNDSSIITVERTSINSNFLEFSPTFYDNGLLFVTSNKNKSNRKKKNYFDIAYAKFEKNGAFEKPSFFDELNTPYHEGPLAFSSKTQKFYITRSCIHNNKLVTDSLGLNRLNIYEVSIAKNQLTELKLPFNNNDFSSLHPTLANNNSRLYFASDRPGGFGGMDIWYSQKTDSLWGEPVLLDSTVNSPDNEIFPFIYQDSILYFATNRVDSNGLDIYAHQLSSSLTQKLPSPINSTKDDFGLIVSPSGKTGYFSSNRDNNDDIYSFQANQLLFPIKRRKAIHFLFINKSNQQPIKNAKVSLIDNQNDTIWATTNNLGHSSFEIDYAKHYQLDFAQKGFESLTKPVLDTFDFVQTIAINAQPQPCINIEGTIASMDLKIPIPNATLVIVPSIDSSLSFTIISDQKGIFSYCLPAYWTEYSLSATKDGFISYEMSYKINEPPRILLMPYDDEVVKQTVILENIYYDFNDSRIQENSATELIKLAQILNDQPKISILLIAYTDSRGTKLYNERLARHRARAAKAFLVNLGITSSRIKPIGRGEVNIRNRCKNGVNCSEEEHRYNRRTEVIFRNIPENVMVIVKKKWHDDSL